MNNLSRLPDALNIFSEDLLFGARRRRPTRKTRRSPTRKTRRSPTRKTRSPYRKKEDKKKRKKPKNLSKRQKRLKAERRRILKKVMDLHHNKGMSLKQAWKVVNKNKFGGTFSSTTGNVPIGMELNPLWYPGSRSKKWVEICPAGKYRSPISNKCINMKVPKSMDPFPSPRLVPSGWYVNPETGRLKKIRDPVPEVTRARNVKPGYEINPETGRSRKMCEPGKYRDPVTGRCRKIKIAVGTPVGDLIDFSDFGKKRDFGGFKYGKKRDFGGFKYGKKIHGRSTAAFGNQLIIDPDNPMIWGVKGTRDGVVDVFDRMTRDFDRLIIDPSTPLKYAGTMKPAVKGLRPGPAVYAGDKHTGYRHTIPSTGKTWTTDLYGNKTSFGKRCSCKNCK